METELKIVLILILALVAGAWTHGTPSGGSVGSLLTDDTTQLLTDSSTDLLTQ